MEKILSNYVISIRVVIIGLCLCFWLGFAFISAADICTRDPLTVNEISGKVVTRPSKGEEPIYLASIKLFRTCCPKSLVAKTQSDVNGNFSFTKTIKPGEYILQVSFPHFGLFEGNIILVESKQHKEQELIIVLGMDFLRPCDGTFAELQPKPYQ